MSYSRPGKNLNGLSGWLVLVGLGVVLAPFRILVSSATYADMFGEGKAWDLLTKSDSPVFNPWLAAFIGGELFFNACMFFVSIVLLWLFFKKHYLFPRVFIACTLLNTIVYFADAWVASQWTSAPPLSGWEYAKELMQIVAPAIVWVPYMIASDRVRQTFVQGKRDSVDMDAAAT